MKKRMIVGFIGQGYVGKAYADNFEDRGFDVVRYSLESEYYGNKEALKKCGLVFIAVPTPTTAIKSDWSIVKNSLGLLSPNTIVVIKSTILPGTTQSLQSKHKDLVMLHSPEFLTSQTARADVDMPQRNIIGLPVDTDKHRKSAKHVLDILPKAPFKLICTSLESEFIKYASNTFYYAKVVYMNALYDLAIKLGVDWSDVKLALAADPWIGPMHIEPIHKTGRGAGGHCLIKDYAAFKSFFEKNMSEATGHVELLAAIEKMNLHFLTSTNKDLEILKKVYGRDF
ncbi:MAG: hypothetical protein NT077_02935 [Candidatus Taylorbacteria bacterium]|nr:hypothetical protein [Candidatus Taylorbacteria bacterium]